jgi:Domain of unknown function (DUF6265)
MKPLLLLPLTILLSISFQKSPVSDSIKQFKWLQGNWMLKKKNGGAIMENWLLSNDTTLSGESLSFSATGMSKVSETLELVYRNNQYYYISTVKEQNNNQAVIFTITSHTDTSFVAENPEHDFPKRITYILTKTDSLHAFIDGGPAIPDKRADYFFSRYKK